MDAMRAQTQVPEIITLENLVQVIKIGGDFEPECGAERLFRQRRAGMNAC
jgi:hypothetical protein